MVAAQQLPVSVVDPRQQEEITAAENHFASQVREYIQGVRDENIMVLRRRWWAEPLLNGLRNTQTTVGTGFSSWSWGITQALGTIRCQEIGLAVC